MIDDVTNLGINRNSQKLQRIVQIENLRNNHISFTQ